VIVAAALVVVPVMEFLSRRDGGRSRGDNARVSRRYYDRMTKLELNRRATLRDGDLAEMPR